MGSVFATMTPHLADEKRRAKLAEIESRLKEHDFPPQLVIENTSVCNLVCIHCSHREMERAKRPMERALWDKIVEEVGRESPDCEVWPTFYGEALIMGYKNELWDRLDYAEKVGCRNLVLNSNGTLLDRWDNIEKILDSPLKRFIISLDGFTKETFEKVRAKAKWEEVYPGVEKLLRRREERGQVFPVIVCQYSILPENAHEVEDFRKYWKNLGAEVKVRPMMEWTSIGSVRTDTIMHDTNFRIACPWGNNTMAIHQDGSVVCCAVDYAAKVVVGNVREMSVKDAWLRLGEQVRRPHIEHRWNEVPDLCKGCGDWQVAGAEYEEQETAEGTRPFWFYDEKAQSAG